MKKKFRVFVRYEGDEKRYYRDTPNESFVSAKTAAELFPEGDALNLVEWFFHHCDDNILEAGVEREDA